MRESDLYRPLDLPPKLVSLTQEILCQLRNAVFTHGVEAERGVRTLAAREPHEISVTISESLENRSMVLIGNGGVTKDGSFVFRLAETLGFEPAMIIWDRRVTVEDAEELIERAPEIGQKMKEELASGQSPKMRVDEVFTEPGVVLPIFPGGPDAETTLQDFDRPEELTIIENFGMQSVCRRRDIHYLQQRRRVVLEILGEEGTDPLEVQSLSIERILKLRGKVEERLKQ